MAACVIDRIVVLYIVMPKTGVEPGMSACVCLGCAHVLSLHVFKYDMVYCIFYLPYLTSCVLRMCVSGCWGRRDSAARRRNWRKIHIFS